MKRKIFCVLDVRSGLYSAPWLSVNSEVAIRDFARAVADPQTDLHHAPADYSLMYLGQYDDQTGLIDSANPEPIVNGLQCVVEQPEA